MKVISTNVIVDKHGMDEEGIVGNLVGEVVGSL